MGVKDRQRQTDKQIDRQADRKLRMQNFLSQKYNHINQAHK